MKLKKKLKKKPKLSGISQSVQYVGKVGVLTSLPGMHYIEVSKGVVKQLGGTFKVRLICEVSRRGSARSVSFQCGLMPLGEGVGYIMITRKRLKEIGAEAGARVQVLLKLDPSRYGLPMPPELKELLKQDPEGRKRFEGLTAGKQRNILHYVGSSKNSEKRLERAFRMIEKLKQLPPGKESIRELFQAAVASVPHSF